MPLTLSHIKFLPFCIWKLLLMYTVMMVHMWRSTYIAILKGGSVLHSNKISTNHSCEQRDMLSIQWSSTSIFTLILLTSFPRYNSFLSMPIIFQSIEVESIGRGDQENTCAIHCHKFSIFLPCAKTDHEFAVRMWIAGFHEMQRIIRIRNLKVCVG